MKRTDEPVQDDPIGSLLRLAGRRPMPSRERMQDARHAAHAAWTRAVERRTRAIWWWALSGAAVAAAVLGVLVSSWPRHPVAPIQRAEIGRLDRSVGAVFARRTADGAAPAYVMTPHTPLVEGTVMETADDGRAAVMLKNGLSMRLDHATRVTFDAMDHARLERGAVYVDAGTDSGGAGLQLDTSVGTIRHIGTQFEARIDGLVLRTRVREGAVRVDGADTSWTTHAGETLLLTRGQQAEVRKSATSGPEWEWVSTVAPPFRLEGARMPAFLQWVSREKGWRWEFADATTRRRAEAIVLHGALDDLTPDEMLEAVLPASGMTSRREGDRLIVRFAQ